jgi:Fe-Mn family superoxide dismutase
MSLRGHGQSPRPKTLPRVQALLLTPGLPGKETFVDQRIQPLRIDPARLHGLSERLVASHHQNNYGGAVRRLNAIRAQLAALDFTTAPGFQLNGLKREELIALNSMLLHELHFACLGGNGRDMAPAMALALAANFGSAERWREEFVAMGKALAGGSGWVLLTFSPCDGTLMNQWASDHTQAAAGAVPLLALDMYEHAYHLDFGAKADAWVDAFMRNIHWEGVYDRYRAAVTDASEPFGVDRAQLPEGTLLDVRRAAVFEQDGQMIPGARWADPAGVGQWGQALPPDAEVVVYCVYGHEVGRSTALRLRAQGVQAWFLRGGIDGWKAAGMPLSAPPPAPAASPGRS